MNGTVKRTIFGVLFLAVMLGGLLFYETLYLILFAFITGGMLYEFYRMTMGESFKDLQRSGIFVGILIFLAANKYFFSGNHLDTSVAFSIIGVLYLMVRSIIRKDHTDFLKTGYLYAGLVYIGLPMALSNAVVSYTGEYSGLLMVAFFCIIWASDVGAYCFGMLFGQKSWSKKMCPSISPKKSWAGFWGGLFMAMVAGAILYWTGLFLEDFRIQLASALGHDFAQDDTRYNGISGEVAAAVERVFRHGIPRVTYTFGIHLHAVYQQHGFPVGENPHDSFAVCHPL